MYLSFFKKIIPLAISFALVVALFVFYDIDSKLLLAFDIRLFLIFILVAVLISILGSLRLYFNLKPFYYGVSFGTAHQVNIYSMLSGLYLAGIIGSTLTKVSLPIVNKVNKNLFIIISIFEKAITLGFISIVGIISFLVLRKVDFLTAIRFGSSFDFLILAVLLFGGVFFYFKNFTYQLFRIISALLFSTSFYSLMIVLLNLIPVFLILNNLLDVSLAEKLVYTTALMFVGSLPVSFQGIGLREVAAVYLLSQYNIDTSLLLGNILMVSFASIVVISIMPLTINLFPNNKKEIIEKKETLFYKSLSYLEKNIGLLSIPCIILGFFEIRILFFKTQIPITLGDLFAIVLFFILIASIINKNVDVLLKKATVIILMILSYFLISFLYGWLTNEASFWAFNNRVVGGLFLLGYVQAGFLFFKLDKVHIRNTLLIIFWIIAIYFLKLVILHVLVFLPEQTYWGKIGALKELEFTGPGLNSVTAAFYLCFIMLLYFIGYYKKLISKQLFLSSAFVLSVCVGLSHSLCGILTVAVFGITWLGYNIKKQLVYVIVILLGLLFSFVLLVGFYSLQGKTQDRFQTAEFDCSIVKNNIIKREIYSSNSWRKSCDISLNLLKQNWFFGAGLGGTLIEFGKSIEIFPKKYNSISLYLGDTGLVGFFLIGFFFFWLYSLDLQNQKDKFLLKVFFWSAIICIGIFSIVHDISYQRILWVWVGAFLSLTAKPDDLLIESSGNK